MSFLGIKNPFEPEIKNGEKTGFSKIKSLDEAAGYIKHLKAKVEDGTIKPEMNVTTATSPERRAYLNYCISLVKDKYIKHKILLFLRVNPYWEDPTTGREAYLSKRELARCLSDRVGFRVLELEIDAIERDAMQIIKDTISRLPANSVPLVGGKY